MGSTASSITTYIVHSDMSHSTSIKVNGSKKCSATTGDIYKSVGSLN